MSKGLVLVGIGAAIGLAMGVGLERLMNAMLFNAGGVDLLVYLIVVPAMVLVTMLAAYVPARKATHGSRRRWRCGASDALRRVSSGSLAVARDDRQPNLR